jgi:hypothetical protein
MILSVIKWTVLPHPTVQICKFFFSVYHDSVLKCATVQSVQLHGGQFSKKVAILFRPFMDTPGYNPRRCDYIVVYPDPNLKLFCMLKS